MQEHEIMSKAHDQAFKEHAVNLWQASNRSAQAIADELGIKRDRLYVWKQELSRSAAPAAHTLAPHARTAEQWQQEAKRLERENQQLRQEREILKKTLGILSEPSRNAANGSKA
jgi:transposase